MITEYRIEMWNSISRRYVLYWRGYSQEMANVMMFKPYNRHTTRRLVKTSKEVLYTEKAKKK